MSNEQRPSWEDRPEFGTPEFEKWLEARIEKSMDRVANPIDTGFDEHGLVSGGPEIARKSDREAFPSDFDEYGPDDPKIRRVK